MIDLERTEQYKRKHKDLPDWNSESETDKRGPLESI